MSVDEVVVEKQNPTEDSGRVLRSRRTRAEEREEGRGKNVIAADGGAGFARRAEA
jgi:hypothetical protein